MSICKLLAWRFGNSPVKSSHELALRRCAVFAQVELLLTLEEYCEESRNGHTQCNGFEAVFQQVTKQLESLALYTYSIP